MRNLYHGQEAAVRTQVGTTDWFKIEKGVRQGCILSPYLFNLYAENIIRNAGLDESDLGLKIAGQNINNLRYADDTTLLAENESDLKELIAKVKEESLKAGLQLNPKKTKIMSIGAPGTWEIDGEPIETVSEFNYLGSHISDDGRCTQEIRRRLILGKQALAALGNILRNKDLTIATKVRIVRAMVFPVATYGSESWVINKHDRERIDSFEIYCWRRLLRIPWTARRTNKSVLEEIRADHSLESQILKQQLKYLGHIMRRSDSLEKTLLLGKIEGKRRQGGQRVRWLDQLCKSTGLSLRELKEAVRDRAQWRAKIHSVTHSRPRLNE
jgi:hypothetical protein